MSHPVPTNVLIQSLVTYIDLGSGWEASLELGYNGTATVGRHIAQLEDRYGVNLVERDNSGRRVAKLTQAGKDVLSNGIGCERKE